MYICYICHLETVRKFSVSNAFLIQSFSFVYLKSHCFIILTRYTTPTAFSLGILLITLFNSSVMTSLTENLVFTGKSDFTLLTLEGKRILNFHCFIEVKYRKSLKNVEGVHNLTEKYLIIFIQQIICFFFVFCCCFFFKRIISESLWVFFSEKYKAYIYLKNIWSSGKSLLYQNN